MELQNVRSLAAIAVQEAQAGLDEPLAVRKIDPASVV